MQLFTVIMKQDVCSVNRSSVDWYKTLGTENPALLPGGVAAAGGGKLGVAAELFSQVLLVARVAFGLLLGRHASCSRR